MSNVILDTIKEEINWANFVSNKLNETTDIISKSQLSTVFRYILDSITRKCFIEFSDVSKNQTAAGLFIHITNTIQEFNICNKLIGQTYDEAAVMSGHLDNL